MSKQKRRNKFIEDLNSVKILPLNQSFLGNLFSLIGIINKINRKQTINISALFQMRLQSILRKGSKCQ